MKKRLLALLLIAAMAMSLAACGGSGSAETTTAASGGEEVTTTEASGGEEEEETTEAETEDPYADCDKEIVVGISADPTTFYPWGGFSQGGRHIFPMIYQTLLSDVRDPDTGDITHYHALMESYEQVDDTHWTVKLYEGIKDTAGNDFTANDVVYCWTMFQSESPAASNIGKLVGYEATDDLTVECEVKEGTTKGDFEEILTTVNMVTQASYEASSDGFATDPVGTTGYVLSDYQAGTSATVTLAEGDYWNQAANDTKDVDAGYIPTSDNTNVKTVKFEFITDTNTMAIALENGEIDIATSVSTTDISFYTDDDYYSVHEYPDNMFGLVFNAGDTSEFSDINLRQAVAYAVSAEDLLGMIYDGDGWQLKAFAMDYQIGYVKDWDDKSYFEQDMDKAQEYWDAYLKSSGKSASDLSFNLIYMNTDVMQKYAQVVQAALIELSGNDNICALTSYDSATYTTMRADPNNFDMCILNSMSNKTYVSYNWNLNYNGYDRTDGNDISFSGDSKLWDLCQTACETLEEDDCTAFQDYLDEQCYFVNYICGPAYWVGSNIVTKWVLGAKNSIAICAMNFDWSVKY